MENNNEILQRVAYYITNGVVTNNGQKRKFDILDYYVSFKKLDLNNIKSGDAITKKCLIIVKNFLNSNDFDKATDIRLTDYQKEMILEESYKHSIQFDNNGLPIPGTGIEMSNEDKQKIFDYIEEHKLPPYYKTYVLLRKRFINKEIVFEDEIKNKKGIK